MIINQKKNNRRLEIKINLNMSNKGKKKEVSGVNNKNISFGKNNIESEPIEEEESLPESNKEDLSSLSTMDYLQSTVSDALTEGLTKLAQMKKKTPKEALIFLGEFLKKKSKESKQSN